MGAIQEDDQQMKEYYKRCQIALEEWEWSGRGYCELCEEYLASDTHTSHETGYETMRTAIQYALLLPLGCLFWLLNPIHLASYIYLYYLVAR